MQTDENTYNTEGVDFVDYTQASAKSFKSGCVEGSLEGTVRCDWISVNIDRPFGYYDTPYTLGDVDYYHFASFYVD